jgi:putative SOS response-associated peptidase YedK
MCGRFSQHSELMVLADRFDTPMPAMDFQPRYNLAPSQDALVVIQDSDRHLISMRWGLVPAWAKDPHATPRPINARSEDAASKPIFRHAYRRRRCLVPADGFYEWRPAAGKGKAPMLFCLRDRAPFAMAGLYESWHGPEGPELLTFTILTMAANDVVRPVHDRMPVMLLPENEAPWLDPDQHDPEALARLVQPYPGQRMEAYQVSTAVNSPINEGAKLIEPVPADPALF